jgi:hypothetical protein
MNEKTKLRLRAQLNIKFKNRKIKPSILSQYVRKYLALSDLETKMRVQQERKERSRPRVLYK